MSVDRYTVIRTNDCVVIEGHLPLADCGALLRVWSEYQVEGDEWVLDPYLSNHLNVNVVAGPRSACQAWRERLGIVVNGPPGGDRAPGEGEVAGDDKNAPNARYRLVQVPYPGIHCLQCGMVSFNANDVTHRFCAKCDEYLEGE